MALNQINWEQVIYTIRDALEKNTLKDTIIQDTDDIDTHSDIEDTEPIIIPPIKKHIKFIVKKQPEDEIKDLIKISRERREARQNKLALIKQRIQDSKKQEQERKWKEIFNEKILKPKMEATKKAQKPTYTQQEERTFIITEVEFVIETLKAKRRQFKKNETKFTTSILNRAERKEFKEIVAELNRLIETKFKFNRVYKSIQEVFTLYEDNIKTC